MPPASTQLDINVNVSVSKRFIKDSDVKNILLGKYDWNTPKLQFKGKTVGRSNVGNHVMYDVILDEVPAVTMKLKQGCLKYLSPGASASITEEPNEPSNLPVVSEDLLDDAIQSEEEEEEEIDLTPGDGWTSGEVFVDSRLCSESYRQSSSKLNMENQRYESPLSYFLFFLPHEQIHRIIGSTNSHARNVDASWRDINYNEYMMWLALLTVMTVIRHSDRKAYWKQGSSHFTMSIDFRRYMSFNRFEEIMQMHTFEIPTIEKQQNDPLYQIRATITAFNEHMASCIVPGKYLVVDESMNQWLGIGMPNLKKVPRKPHPIGQEFKTLADHHSYCILQMDTVSDPVSKKYDNEPGMKKLTATIKRLVKPWFGSGRTVIADSWFGSPDMTAMLSDLGLYSIMQVTKRRYWPRGMPVTDIVEQLEPAHGSHYTMKKNSGSGTMFVCSYRDRRVKAFISSCGTTSRLGGQRTSVSSGSLEVAVSRPNVVNEYETHKSSVDAANNLRDNKISYHDIISTERWEMRFFGFFLGICEANAFSAYRVFNENGGTTHSAFKDSLAWSFLKHCEVLNFGSTSETIDSEPRVLRSHKNHKYISMNSANRSKRRRLVCRDCKNNGISGIRVEKCCSCNPDRALCKGCHQDHLCDISTQ